MMVYTKNLVLVCTGRDTARAAGQGMPVLHLCLGITPKGALQRLQLPTAQAHCLLGLCDPPLDLALCNPDRLAAALLEIQGQRSVRIAGSGDYRVET